MAIHRWSNALLVVLALAAMVGGSALLGRLPSRVPSNADLPGGYIVWRTNSYTVVLLRQTADGSLMGSPHVGARIDRMSATDRFIYGHVSPSPRSELASEQRAGYFFIDTKPIDHVLRIGLTEDEFHQLLQRHGVSASMHDPRWFEK